MNERIRWIAVVAALVLAAIVGYFAYSAGVAQGIAESGRIAAPAAGPGPWHYHPWGWGFPFFFAPFFFLVFVFMLMRAMFGWRRGCGYSGYHHHYREQQQQQTDSDRR